MKLRRPDPDDPLVRCPRCHGADGSYRRDNTRVVIERYFVRDVGYVLSCRSCIGAIRAAIKRPKLVQQELAL